MAGPHTPPWRRALPCLLLPRGPGPGSRPGSAHTVTSPCLTSAAVGPPPLASPCMSRRARVSPAPSCTLPRPPPSRPVHPPPACSASEAGLVDASHRLGRQGRARSEGEATLLGCVAPGGGVSCPRGGVSRSRRDRYLPKPPNAERSAPAGWKPPGRSAAGLS